MKNLLIMKHTKSVYFLFFVLLISISCQEYSEDFFIIFENDSDKTICVSDDGLYPVDSLLAIRFMVVPGNYYEIPPRSQSTMTWGVGKWQSWYVSFDSSDCGYVSFTILDSEVMKSNNVESIQENYNILARYDLTKEDLEKLKFKLTYPPTPEMSHVHMWIKP